MERKKAIAAIGIVAVVVLAGVIGLRGKKSVVAVAAKPALTVLVTLPEEKIWAERITASGSIQPWQETIVGAELGGLRLAEVLVNVGDRVRKGDLLARFADEIKLAELSQQQASYDEAGAHFAEASANAQRALKIRDSGVMSEQELQQLATAADTARAQMQLAGARLDAEKLRYRYTRVTAPDDGLISSRTATVGAVVQSGAELFRMIRRGRLEWHADLPADAIQRVRIGQKVLVMLSGGEKISAVVARISPLIDAQSRNGKVYVELPESKTLRAGMFVQGEFDLGQTHALTVPQSALVIRDGYAYLYQPGNDNHVVQIKVSTGRRVGDRVEITGGIKRDSAVVASGAGFLNDGDLVRIAPTPVKPEPR